MENERLVMESVVLASELSDQVPQLVGVKTGVEGLDDLFYTTRINEEGKPEVRPLGGYPIRGVINITGIPDTGKSLMVEQFAVKQASLGNPVCFVTVEQPAPFLVHGLRQRALAMGIDFSEIEDRLVIIDAASNSVLREDIPTLLNTLAYAIKTYKTKATVIDSVTGLYEAREMMARQIVRSLYNFMKKWHQTSLFVSQKRSGHEELTAEAAGGYAVGHIVDGTIVVSKQEILTKYEQSLYGKEIGDVIRLMRIDGCRLCGHNAQVHILEIDQTGIVKITSTLKDYLANIKKGR